MDDQTGIAQEVEPTWDNSAPIEASAIAQQPSVESEPTWEGTTSSEEQYGTLGQQVKAGAEAIGRGVLGPIATFTETKAFHVKPEDILGRKEENPILHGVGEAVGLGAGILTGTGLGGVMTKAGKAAEVAVGLGNLAKEAPLIQRIGSSAVQQAAEMAVLQSSSEMDKMILNDPEASSESALSNIGMAAALGGAGGAFITGAVSPLWKATVGTKAAQALGALTSKLGGVEGASLAEAEALATKAAIEIPDALKAKINNAPGAEAAFSTLSQTDTSIAGRKFQKTIGDFNEDLSNKMVETLGVEAGYTKKLPDLDKYTTGQKIGEALHSDLQKEIKPISDAYDSINEKFRSSTISDANKAMTAESIAQKSLEQGWHKAESDAQVKLMDRVLEKLPKQETAEDLKKFITNLRDSHPYGSETYAAAKDIVKVLNDAQERTITSGILAKGGEPAAAEAMLAGYKDLKSKYSGYMDKLDGLNEHLHVGKYSGPQSFLSNLKEMSSTNGEGILNRLSGKSKSQVLELLSEISPNALAEVRRHHVDSMLHAATDASGKLSPYKLMTQMEKLSPQLKGLINSPESQARMEALSQIAEKLKDSGHNWSNTARTVDKIAKGAASPLVLMAGLLGHGGAAILTHLGGLGFAEGKDALKLGMLKFLGSSQPINSEAFKSMVSFMHNAQKGQSLILNATKSVLESGTKVLTSSQMPDKKDTEKLDKAITKLQSTPTKVMELNSPSLGHYLPDHQMSLSGATARATQYLQSIKPQPYKPHPFDREIAPTKQAMARYQRALEIAQQPAIIMHHIKDGTLQQSDMQDLGAMYPGLYRTMADQLSKEVQGHKDPSSIPYKTKIGISLFLGQPLDSSMIPMTIQSTQSTHAPKQPQQPPQGGQPKGNPGKLGKTNKSYMTPLQASEEHKASKD